MMSTPHLLTGAAMGARIRPLWALCLCAFASHFALDHIPHLEPSVYYRSYTLTPLPIKMVAYAEILLGTLLTLWFACRPTRSAQQRPMLLGAFFAALPDLWDNVPFWSRTTQRIPGIGPGIHWLHLTFHRRLLPEDWLFGLLVQIAVAAVAILILIKNRQDAQDG